jgi:DNA-binding MarR family transcriptional regulator/ribosomal protein S18 acetylase RimI-like enzyme
MTMPAPGERRVGAVRRFNRLYTRQIGLLRKTYLDSPYSLGEMRVLYEIARGDAPTASDIASELDLDAAYLSRVLRSFEKRGLITRKTSDRDARRSHLTMTSRGRKMFAPLEQRSQQQAEAILAKLPPADQTRLITAMETIETLLEGNPAPEPKHLFLLRPPRHGDFGWIVKRHAELYANEYGWIEPFEGLCAQIVADFVNNYDRKLDRCWIAEHNGENVGSVMLVKDSPGVARLRLLLVDPKARGLGLGAQLTGECIRFARAAGFKKIVLWTHSNLSAARHIYQNAGFEIVRTERHKSWSRPVVSEHWELNL